MNRITLALALACIAVPAALPVQDSTPPASKKAAPANDVFSGTVSDVSEESVTVVRSALARETVKRTFILDSQTVVEGKLRSKVRVTVHYATDENGQFHALHIIVR